jgi:hypothetical protein
LFTKSDDEFTGPIAQGSMVGPRAKDLKEPLAKVGIMAESMTEDTKGARGIAEALGDLSGGATFDEVGAEGLVLALLGGLGSGEELGGLPFR